MSRRWLLSLLCLSVLFLSLVQLTRARGEFRVNEATTRILLEKQPAEVLLAVENSTGETLNTTVVVEVLDPSNNIWTKTTQSQSIKTGSQKLSLSFPLSFTALNEKERSQLLWYRLHYRIIENGDNAIADGIVSLSEITPDLFDLRVATSGLARERGHYVARVQASHPITRRPAADVRIDGEVTLEDDDDNSVKVRASKTTDAKGYAVLDFALPPRFPQFPHTIQPAGGELQLAGKKGAIVAAMKAEVLVDQFARILVSSDKPLYQPGQVMHVRALLFTPSKQALANQNALIRIADPDGATVFRTTVSTSRFGVANADWSIPETTRLGDYRVWVGFEGDDDQSGESGIDVRISRYDLPNFSVSVETDRPYYLPGQNAEIKIRADYLFGQPVTRGHVRLVREEDREWNYEAQKWDIDEGDTYEGDTDAKGFFVANVDLANDYEDLDDQYHRFRDHTYAAYFTDPTTNRTEQRRFDLRVTKEAIHVYVIQNDEWVRNKTLPLKFYVSTFYADGSPARCKVNVSVTDQTPNQPESAKRSLATVRTNRYGLAKVSGVRLPRELENESQVDLLVSVVDSKGLKGTNKEDISLSDEQRVRVESDKALYRRGEPITALVTASVPDQTVVVDVLKDSSVIRSERVKLHDGRASVVFPYRPEFKDKLSIVAYGDFPQSTDQMGSHTILYPQDSELKVNVRPSQSSYRPGEDAQVNLSVRSPEGRVAESALGVVVMDKAVEERFRTAQEFGSRSSSLVNSVQRFLGLNEQVAGVSLRDLQRLDMSKPVSPELDLLADVLLSQSRGAAPTFHGGDQYDQDQAEIFRKVLTEQLKPMREALTARYDRTAEYPTDEQSLKRLLSESKIDFNSLRDAWGNPYRPSFSVFQQSENLTLTTAGPDKRFDTPDDFSIDRLGWPYFRPVGETIDTALHKYHDRTGGFVRDAATLRDELSRNGLDLDQLHDRWGRPYRFEFDVNLTNYVTRVRSAGPDKEFSADRYYFQDDFIIWTSSIDYFEKTRSQIDDALKHNSESSKKFPENEQDLRTVLRDSPGSLDTLRDPWNRPYYATFNTETLNSSRVLVETRANLGGETTPRTVVSPVIQTARFIALRSMGPDGKPKTADDFPVAVFAGVIAEQARGASEPPASISKVIFSGNSGGIHGVVTDPMGAVIAGTTVTAKLSDRDVFQATSGEDGRYGLINLPAGMYEIRFSAPGFSVHQVTNVLVRPSYITEIDVSLQPGSVVEAVYITDSSDTALNFALTTTSRNISSKVKAITKTASAQQISTPRLREYFPETLLWQPSVETDKQGRAQINFKLADNITTWKMIVIGSTEDGQIGVTEKEIKAFQPFFVEHEPPRVLTEGDEISLPVTVRNYLERPQTVDLEIKPEQWFSLLGPTRKQASVAAGDAARETFDLRAIASIKNGKQRITAIGSDDSDAIEKPVTVHPDGEELSVTAGGIIADDTVLELNLPQAVLPNSKRAEVKIYPSMMAHVMESVEGIMERPYGCGEQTISSTYPSLLALRHYKQSGGDFPVRKKAERYVNEGYNRLLNYRAERGGFSYWGRGEPDLALTAYAVRFLNAASDVISVDPEVLKAAREWLIEEQQPDGSWDSPVLTAYVARVLAQGSREPSEAVKKAIAYLDKTAPENNESYLLASYALAAIEIGDLARAKTAIDKLRTMANSQGASTYWTLQENTPFNGWGLTGQVETTALVIQALAKYCDSQTTNCESEGKLINRALLFLLKEKDRYGVWYSTQTTINTLDSLLALLSKNSVVGSISEETVLLVNGRMVQTLRIPVADRSNNPIAIDITEFVNAGKNRIEFKREGGLPLATAQAVANFYVPWSDSTAKDNGKRGLRLQVKFDKTEGRINDEITCNVEADRSATHGYGMLLAEIGLPPGADVDRSSLQAAMQRSDWAISQYDVLPDRVVVYLLPPAGGAKFSFKFRPRLGLNAKTAPSVVYDYYNPEARAVVAPATFRVR